MQSRFALAILVLTGELAGCSPRLDWREVRIPDSGLTALLPCRPASQARRLVLAGSEVKMSMLACTGDSVVYAVTSADVAQPGHVGTAMAELHAAAARNLGAAPQAPVAFQVPGSTPNAQAGMTSFTGMLGDGRRVEEKIAVFARGTRVYQATMLGPSVEIEASEAFFGGLRFAN
ncbi:MAG: hypothetical protein ABIQ29_08170 [Burkholderiaceae bacterium]